MSEEMLVRYCAPTLAGMKTGALFRVRFEQAQDLYAYIRHINRTVGHKGLRMIPLQMNRASAMLYVYRPAQLARDLADPHAREILRACGYGDASVRQCICVLRRRLAARTDFPHEIGLVLGDPPEDVRGFMENKACLYKQAGFWKVYGDVQAAEKLFCKFRKCTRVYSRCWQNGTGLERLTVAV